jgi:hypothetical protein
MPLSPKDFSFVNAPTDYGPPQVNFSWLSNLVPDYYKAQLAPLELQLKQADLAQKQIELRQYQDFYGGGSPGGQPSAAAQPSTDVAAAPITGRSAGAIAGDPRSKIPVIIAAAQKYGIDPSTAIRVARSEGLASFLGDGGKSGGAFQLYTGGGLGNDYMRDRRKDPLDRANEDDTIDYAMMKAAQGGWGPWNGAKKIGIRGFQGINRGGTQVATAAAPSGFGADATATASPAPGATSGYDRNLTPEQAARAGLTPEQIATDRATVAANAPTGVSTAAPAPEEPVAAGGTSPPFAPARTAAAASTNAAGPQNIKLASIAPNVAGLTPTPPSTVVPTSSAEVAGTQGQGIGTRPSGIGPGNVPANAPIVPGGAPIPQGGQPTLQPPPAQNVAARFPGVGEQLAGFIPKSQQPPPPVAQAEQNIPDPRTDPDLRKLQAQIQNNLGNRLRQAPAGGFLGPMLKNRIDQLDLDLKNLQQQHEDRFNQINAERQRMLGSQSSVKEAEQKRQGEYLDNVARDATNVGRNVAQLDQIAALGRQAPSGAGALLQQWLGSYGIPTKGLTEIQSYQRAIDLLAPQLAGTGESAAKASEIADFRNALGGLLTTPEGRELAVTNLRSMSQYKAAAGRIALDDRLTNSEKMRQLTELPFPRLATEVPKAPGAQQQQNSPTTEEEYRNLKSGTRYQHPKDPIGTLRIKP